MKLNEMLTAAGVNPAIFTGDHWKKVGADLVTLCEQAAVQFVKENKDLAIGLTEEQIKGILFDAIITVPDVPEVPEGSPVELLEAAARVCLAREQAGLLTSQAQKERNVNTAQLEKNAREFAVKLGTLVLNAGMASLGSAAAAAL